MWKMLWVKYTATAHNFIIKDKNPYIQILIVYIMYMCT